MHEMTIQSELHGDLFVVRPQGDVSKSVAAELDELLDTAMDDGARLMVFDCSDLTHISSDGLRVVLKTLRRLRDADGKAALAGAGDKVRSVLEAGGFLALLGEFDTPDSAMQALRAERGSLINDDPKH
jgi:anti-anti-sigma factor